MNWLDVCFALIIGASVFSGVRKGLLRIGIGFGATIVGLLAASWFYGMAGAIVSPYVSSRMVANFLGFFMVFAAVLVFGALFSMALGRILKISGLSPLDRFLGAAFGLVRGLFVCVIVLMVLTAFPMRPRPDAVVNSRLAPYVIEASRVISALTPNELKEGFRRSYENIKKIWSDSMRGKPQKLPVHEI